MYVPKELVDRDAWYFSEEGQKAVEKALRDIEEGRVASPFETAKEALDELSKQDS